MEWIDKLPPERCVFHIHLFGIIQDIRIPVSVPVPIEESGSMSYPTETQLKSVLIFVVYTHFYNTKCFCLIDNDNGYTVLSEAHES